MYACKLYLYTLIVQIIDATNYCTVFMMFAIGGGQKSGSENLKIIKNHTYYCTIFVVNFCTSFMNRNFPCDLDEHPYTQSIFQNSCIVAET